MKLIFYGILSYKLLRICNLVVLLGQPLTRKLVFKNFGPEPPPLKGFNEQINLRPRVPTGNNNTEQ